MNNSSETLIFIILVLLTIMIILIRRNNERRELAEFEAKRKEELAELEAKESRAWAKVDAAVQQHANVLIRKRNQLLVLDDYGKYNNKKWIEEVKRFLNSALIDNLSDEDKEIIFGEYGGIEEILIRIESTLDKHIDNNHEIYENYLWNGSGHDYEHFCADILKKAGWSSRVTTASCDQGAGIIAERHGIKIAIQCKRYNRPVGNKAVQEVVAAKNHYGAQIGIVVASNGYTSSAQALAATNQVILLHHSELHELSDRIGASLDASSSSQSARDRVQPSSILPGRGPRMNYNENIIGNNSSESEDSYNIFKSMPRQTNYNQNVKKYEPSKGKRNYNISSKFNEHDDSKTRLDEHSDSKTLLKVIGFILMIGFVLSILGGSNKPADNNKQVNSNNSMPADPDKVYCKNSETGWPFIGLRSYCQKTGIEIGRAEYDELLGKFNRMR